MKPAMLLACLLAATCAKQGPEPAAPAPQSTGARTALPHIHYYSLGRS